MKIKTASLFSGLLLLLTIALAPLASAGEVKGPPGPDGAEGGVTPIVGFSTGDGAASICSFSGLNDLIEEAEPTSTQSYGTFLVLVMKTAGVSAQEAKVRLEDSPGHDCNPNRFVLGNPKKG